MNIFTTLTDEPCRSVFEKHGVVLAYLFGSFARGTENAMSDIDIAFLFSEERENQSYEHRPMWGGREFDVASDIKKALEWQGEIDSISLNTLNNPLLRHEIVFGGKLVFAAPDSDEKKFSLERRALFEYEDTKRIRKTQFDILKERTLNAP